MEVRLGEQIESGQIMDLVEPFLRQYGYIGILVFVFLGNLGMPVPEEAVVLFAGYLTWRETLRLPLVLVVAVASAVAGDSVGYWVGRAKGRGILIRYGRYLAITPRLVRKADSFFQAHGDKTVFSARFIPGIRFLAGPLAGASKMPFPRFFFFNLSGAVVWVSLMIALGHSFGAHLHLLLRRVRRVEELLAALAIAAVLIIWLRQRGRRRNSGPQGPQSGGADPP
ncbi:MAG TPA: DedA family protein [Candidatus Sulfotelmatobacter sp.]|nr:DedA family protein [Candidatus Sulfotelmatobacter sp.]